MLPDFSFEKIAWEKGLYIVAGADEVGRGALAGPVYTAAVVFSPDTSIKILINDSKKLKPSERLAASIWIKNNALCYGIGSSTVSYINKHGIVAATNRAFRRAIQNAQLSLKSSLDLLLVDAFYIPFVKNVKKNKQNPIIKGDTKSVSIAAASIVAKVERDLYMEKLGSRKKYREYGWTVNKGYGTELHKEAIFYHGITPHHRVGYVKTLLTKSL